MIEMDFATFRTVCKHGGNYHTFNKDVGSVLSCTFKNGENARCWDDWQPCDEMLCIYAKKNKIETEDF